MRHFASGVVAAALFTANSGGFAAGVLLPPSEFSLRADPVRAQAITAFLQEVAQPVEVRIPKGTDPKTFLKQRCASGAVEQVLKAAKVAEDRPDRITVSPCLRAQADVHIRVQPGDTLEELALRLGLHAGSAGRLKVLPKSKSTPRGDATRIQPGDTVVASEIPVWTVFRPDPTRIASFDNLVSELARRLGCGNEKPEKCLIRLRVAVVERNTPVHWGGSFNVLNTADHALKSWSDGGRIAAINNVIGGVTSAPFSSEVVAPPPPQPSPSTSSAAASPPMAVAAAQWPFDTPLIGATVSAVLDAHPDIKRTLVGIAEGGLANAKGGPLPEEVYTRTPGDPNSGFEGDLIGAGGERGDEMASGDVGLCPPPYLNAMSTWHGITRQAASHGAIVTSVASGLQLRTKAPGMSKVLPEIIFFRLSRADCVATPDLDTEPDDLQTGFDYLVRRNAPIVSVSYIYTKAGQPYFVDTLTKILASRDMLLVMSAGNESIDLDEMPWCPPCLSSPFSQHYNALVGNRTLVVGAATSALQRASYSAKGDLTVRFYAPGEPVGALDVYGKDASTEGATSYAAPYAALAAALMQSLGMTRISDIAHRLRATTWPLLVDGVNTADYSANVLDLTKAAAVRHYAVEVMTTQNGGPVRQTYVGLLNDKLESLSLCAGRRFAETSIQAVRLGAADASGERQVTPYPRFPRDIPLKPIRHCKPDGVLRMRAFGHGDVSFPMETVTQILVPWIAN